VQVRLNLVSKQSDEKLKALLLDLHQSLAAKVCHLDCIDASDYLSLKDSLL